MAAQERAFEYFGTAVESTKGTAIAAPTRLHYLNGVITPKEEMYYPDDQSGLLAEAIRGAMTRRWSEISADGDLNPNEVHRFFACGLNGAATGTLVTGSTYRWTFNRIMTVDNLKSLTGFWGDPNATVWQAPLMMPTEFTIVSDGKGTEATKFGVELFASEELALGSPPANPSAASSIMLLPHAMQVWLESTSAAAYGTTEITSRVLRVEHKVPSGVTMKFGPGGVGIRRTGVAKARPITTVELEVLDNTQYAAYQSLDGLPVRIRARHQTVGNIDGSNKGYIEVDTYGPMTNLEWDVLEDSNRTLKFEIPALYDSGMSTDCRIVVQNLLATL